MLPPVGVWVYKIQYRRWQKFVNGDERWSEWSPLSSGLVRSWYSRRRDAEKALKRWQERRMYWVPESREFSIDAFWYAERPYRRDLDRVPNLNKPHRVTK